MSTELTTATPTADAISEIAGARITEDKKQLPPVEFSKLRSMIPRHCFEKSLFLSLFYMFRDLLLLSTCIITWEHLSETYLGLLLFYNIYGFLMWCVFVIGHDCGHGSFSNYTNINDICGHICHMLLFVPYWPWSYSHHKHHLYHNHKNKDHSHPWYTNEEWNEAWIGIRYSLPMLPFTAFGSYLYAGLFDGNHFEPFSRFSLYKNEKRLKPKIQCIVSNIINIIYGVFIYLLLDYNIIIYGYLPTWLMFCFWLFMVTYLQHHDEINHTKLYDDNTFNFCEAALETVDREYGYGIDNFHHNITDCHVVHHLFFTKIPHYHLKDATIAIKEYLNECGKYKFIKHDGRFFIHLYKALFVTHFTGEMAKPKLSVS